MIEPNCDMPWDIYLDWLQDQGNEDLRSFEPSCLVTSSFMSYTYYFDNQNYSGNGEGFNDTLIILRDSFTPCYSGYGSDPGNRDMGCSFSYGNMRGDGEKGYYTTLRLNTGFGLTCIPPN